MVKGGWKPYGNGFASGHAAAPTVAAAAPAVTAGANGGSITRAPASSAQAARKSLGRDFIIAQDGTPYCAIHGTPLEPSKFGGLYCPLPGGGKNGFCTARYNP
ncbi:MAG: hypothetical protein M5R40_07430 [Anaerolineae bacterium]|nr:hypothetical protein [Anaerolineae bacterium]